MADYKKMYLELFSRVEEVIDLLIAAQQQAEDSYVESEDDVAEHYQSKE